MGRRRRKEPRLDPCFFFIEIVFLLMGQLARSLLLVSAHLASSNGALSTPVAICLPVKTTFLI